MEIGVSGKVFEPIYLSPTSSNLGFAVTQSINRSKLVEERLMEDDDTSYVLQLLTRKRLSSRPGRFQTEFNLDRATR